MGLIFAPNITADMQSGQSYKISFEDMERQMTALARRAKVEDQWIYVVEDGTLYDVGTGNDAHSVGIDFSLFNSGQINLRDKHIIDIHIHPWKAHGSRAFLPPSTADLHSQAQHATPKYLEFGALSVGALVLDGHGIWEFKMSSDLEKAVAVCGDDNTTQEKVNSFYDVHMGYRW